MGRAPVSKDKKIEVTALLKDDQSQRTVAKKVGVSQCCVGNVAKKLKVDAPLRNAPGQGRKRLSTEREDRRLLQICKADRTKCSRQSLHFQMEHSYQPVLFVEDSWMLGIVATLPNGNPFEMHHKENFASSLQMIISLGSLTTGNE